MAISWIYDKQAYERGLRRKYGEDPETLRKLGLSSSSSTSSRSGSGGSGDYDLTREQADAALENLSGVGDTMNQNLDLYKSIYENGSLSPQAREAILAQANMRGTQVVKTAAEDSLRGSNGDPFLAAAIKSRGLADLDKAIVGGRADLEKMNQQSKLHALDLMSGATKDLLGFKQTQNQINAAAPSVEDEEAKAAALEELKRKGLIYNGKMVAGY